MIGYNPNFMDNPLFHLGMGLLSVPSRSLDPADVSMGRGLQQGLLSFQQHRANAAERESKEAERELRERKLQAQIAKTEREAQQEAQQQQAMQGLLSMVPEGEREKVAAVMAADPGAGLKMAQGLLSPEAPGSMFELWRSDPAAAAQLMSEQERIKALYGGPRGGTTTINMPSLPFKAQTQPGKQAQDMMELSKIRQTMAEQGQDTRIIDASIAKLREDMSTGPKMGAEESRAQGKMALVEDQISRFNALAEEADKKANKLTGATGLLGGRVTNVQAALGMASDEEYEMKALEASMKSQLGTALSGAAIPKDEWPTYEAQIPRVTDTPSQRAAKARVHRDNMKFLYKRARELRGASEEADVPTFNVYSPPQGGSMSDADRAELQQLRQQQAGQ